MPREDREVWKKRLERWVDSGLTTKEFAAEIGVNPNTLAGWRWRLGAEARQKAAVQPQASFVEVVAPLVSREAKPEKKSAAVTVAVEPIELVLPTSGIRVRVPARFDVSALRRVVDALEAR